MDDSRQGKSLLSELRNRNVYRVGALYLVVGWLVLQVVDVLMSVLQLPAWTGKLVVTLLAIGFPIALVLAWAFELTPEGIRREQPTHASDRLAAPRRKTIDYVIAGFLLLAVAWFAWQHDWRGTRSSPSSDVRALVVLPFENLTNDPEQAFFVSGIHEALIAEMSRIRALRVISRTSAMSFQDSGKSIPEIAQELGVDAVIEGSVLKAGDTVRITVQLIDAASDRHLWAENFDRKLKDILALYSEVTREIAEQIRVTLTADERARLDATVAVNPAVYDLYLKGRYLCDNWSPGEMEQGIRFLERAIALEPTHAPAHAQLALCEQYRAFFGYVRPTDVYERSSAAAARAIELDARLAEAHVALAGIQYYMEYQPRAALASLTTALQLNESSVRTLLHLSWLLGESGRPEEALEHSRRAERLDPLSPVVVHAAGQVHYLARNYPEAITVMEQALDLDRSDPSMHYFLAWPHEQLGNFEQAIALHRRAIELSGGSPLYQAALGHTLGAAGRTAEAREILDALQANPAAAPFDLAIVHLGLGENDQAIEGLEQAFVMRDSHLAYINRDPRFDPLRGDPRFARLMQRVDWPSAEVSP